MCNITMCQLVNSSPRAYWGYHAHFPSAANRLFNSLDPQQQRHLSDEKTAMERGGANGAMPPPTSSLRAPQSKKRPPPLSTEGGKPALGGDHTHSCLLYHSQSPFCCRVQCTCTVDREFSNFSSVPYDDEN